MTDRDPRAERALAAAFPSRPDRAPAWDDVLRRAGRHAGTRRSGGRRAIALAFAVCAVAVGLATVPATRDGLAAAGRDAFDGLGSWLGREPGTPASRAEQAGFDNRNDASYAAFPAGTKLRVLERVSVSGHRYTLLGFRSQGSLCLRLVPERQPGGRGAFQCVTLRELERSSAPVLVASTAFFRAADKNVDGVFGFADDTVQHVEARYQRGRIASVAPANNAFVVLRAQRNGTVKDHPPYDPIVQVKARTRDGRSVAVPYFVNGMVDFTNGPLAVPSYLTFPRVRPSDLPGPTKATEPFRGGTIGWLDRREPRGEPWKFEQRFDRVFDGTRVFSRAVQPDPSDPLRVGIQLVRVGENLGRPHSRDLRPGAIALCQTELVPLGGRSGAGVGCTHGKPWFRKGQPLAMSGYGPGQITQMVGLAADEVAAITIYLASGRVIPAPLHDNAFSFSAPTSQFPAKVVAYDHDRHPIWISIMGGAPRPTPCPPARPARATRPARYEHVDLAARTINGRRLFGESPATVREVLGKPDYVRHFSVSNGHREPTYFYGLKHPIPPARRPFITERAANLTVVFGWRQHRMRAQSFNYRDTNVVDAGLGPMLRLQPQRLQERIGAKYGSKYELQTGYGTAPETFFGCSGAFMSRDKTVSVSFGVDPRAGGAPFLMFHHGY